MGYKTSTILLFLLAGATAAYGLSNHEAADQMLACMRGIHIDSTVEILHVEILHLGIECTDVFGYYAYSNDLGDEIKSLARAIFKDFQKNLKTFEKIMKFAKMLRDSLHDDTKEKVAEGLRYLKEIYKIYKAGKVKRRTLERIVLTGLLSPTGTKSALSSMGKYSAPVGFFADVAEFCLVDMGYEKEGKAVGAAGNTVSGAMLGFSMGGPPGAAIGGGLGLLMWWI